MRPCESGEESAWKRVLGFGKDTRMKAVVLTCDKGLGLSLRLKLEDEGQTGARAASA